MNHLPLARTNNLVVQELASESLICDLENDKVFCLNDTLKLVYQACDGKTSFAELKTRHNLTDDAIYLALEELSAANLLEPGQASQPPLSDLSRREAIAKLALASVAVPAILSTVMPAPAQASSLLPLLANCTTNSQCASNFCTNGPPRCCVPGTLGIRGANVCCTAGVNCATACCVGPVTPTPSPTCITFGLGDSVVACPG